MQFVSKSVSLSASQSVSMEQRISLTFSICQNRQKMNESVEIKFSNTNKSICAIVRQMERMALENVKSNQRND